MAQENENGQEKTEDPSGRKLEKAREEGQVPRSREVPAAMTMAALLLFCYSLGGLFISKAGMMTAGILRLSLSGDITIRAIVGILTSACADFLPVLGILFSLLIVAAVVGNVAVSGFVMSSKPLEFDLTRINPVGKLKEMFFSPKSLVELLKGVAKLTIFVAIAVFSLSRHFNEIAAMNALTAIGSATLLGKIFLEILRNCVVFYFVLAVMDWGFQAWNFRHGMMMTRQEMKDEFKNTEGDPKIKSQLRRRRHELLRSKTKKEVQGADVVITNPTHFAVALRYDESKMGAPVVVAKGADFMALQIKKIAKQSDVAIYEAPPLARFLYASVPVGSEIPEEVYKAVAEILVHVYKLKGRRPRPVSREN